jgi:parallel beta-helix repeat protein
MNRSVVSIIMLKLLLVSMLALVFDIQLAKSEPTTWIVDDDGPADFHTIREAINAINEWDAILVYEGYYAEGQIDIDTNGISLIASGNVTVDGLQQGHVLNINANHVSINGFTIQNSSVYDIYSGIELKGHGNSVINNTVTHNYCGIHLVNSLNNTLSSNNIVNNVEYGIVLNNSQNNTITLNRLVADGWHAMYISHSSNNTISLNNITEQVFIGIDIVYSSNNMISSNIVTNGGFGIAIDKSPNNILRNNIMANNTHNFGLVTEGLYSGDVSLTINDIDASNTVNDKPVYYWVNKRNMTVPSNAGFVALVNCTNIKVNNLDLERNLHGITLLYTDNTEISGNNVPANHRTGIYVLYSFNNTISLNNITDNERGICIAASPRTNVFLNTITSKARYHPGNGISIGYSSNCNVTLNNIVNNWYGVILDKVSATTISFNNIISNKLLGMSLWLCSDNTIFNNNFINNTDQVHVHQSVSNWDCGHPSGGNYWSDYDVIDNFSGLYQDEAGSDGIGDAAYVIDGVNRDRYPLMKPWPSHDVAVINITVSKNVVGPWFCIPINVTVGNQGDFMEIFDVTVYADDIIIGTQTVSSARAVTVLTFTWNMTGVNKETYTISAEASIVLGEIDIADNYLVDSTIEIIPDLNGDGKVDIYDIVLAAAAYGSNQGDPNWNPYADLAPPYGKIDIYDLVTCAYHYGKTWK